MTFVRLLTAGGRTAHAAAAVILVVGTATFQAGCRKVGKPKTGAISTARTDFHGFEAIALRNQMAEIVVVPTIGRVMSFRLRVGRLPADEDPFWRHPGNGGALGPDANGWINYGGDKAWPAPQSSWPTSAGRSWPPPATFDAVPYSMSFDEGGVRLQSPVDPAYGLRVCRTISLDPIQPIMTIETKYEKVRGPPVRVGVWTITQLGVPERLFVLLPMRSSFPNGYALRLPAPPRDLRTDGRLLSLARDPAQKTMIGSDGDALLWIGAGVDLLIENIPARPSGEASRPTAEWPDGAHAQIYTSPGEAEAYVELELLDRLRELHAGESASMTVRYTLRGRQETDPVAEARAAFGTAVGAAATPPAPIRGSELPASRGP